MDSNEDDRLPEWLTATREERLVLAPQFSRDLKDEDKAFVPLADVAFNRHSMNDGHHLSPSDNGMAQVGVDGIRVELVQGIDEESFKRTLSMATRATIGVDISDLKNLEAHADWEEMLKGGLQTALETQVIVFAVSGVSRTNTHQLVRSRRASFHQQSQRASYQGDMPEVRVPEAIYKNRRARLAFFRAVVASWRAYREICEEDISYQDARFVLLEGTTSFIMLEYPVREFLNVYAYRGCSMFQWEMVQVMRLARKALIEAHPWLEPYVKISCEKTGPVMTTNLKTGYQVQVAEHHCTFQGWENVEGQCDFPWAREEARTFKPAHHKIERKNKENNA